MSKTKHLGHTDIEYAINPDGSKGYAWNFYPGCLHKPQGKCPVDRCWAEGMWKRQMGAAAKKGIILPDFHHPHLILERLLLPLSVKKPSRILVNFMGDLFGDWVDPNMQHMGRLEFPISQVFPKGWLMLNSTLQNEIFTVIKGCPQHTFIFLTKNPAGLVQWSPFPDNCWVGVSCTNELMYARALTHLIAIKVKVKFVSFEPLLSHLDTFLLKNTLPAINWLIIGQRTPVSVRTTPKIEWIKEIVEAADKAGIPVFLKENLKPLFQQLGDEPAWMVGWENKPGELRQESPHVKA